MVGWCYPRMYLRCVFLGVCVFLFCVVFLFWAPQASPFSFVFGGLYSPCESTAAVARLNTTSCIKRQRSQQTTGSYSDNAQHAQPARAHLLCGLDLPHERRDITADFKLPAHRLSSTTTPPLVAFIPLTPSSTCTCPSCPHLCYCRPHAVVCSCSCSLCAHARAVVCSCVS